MSAELCSIVIVNYNGVHLLESCLRSVLAQDYPSFEVIVVDNCSTDGSTVLVTETFPSVRLVRSDRNLGFAGGNNRGVVEAKGKYIILLNNDTVVEPGWLGALVRMLRGEEVGAVTSRVVTDGVPAAFYEKNGTINYLGYNIMREFPDLSQIFFAGGASLIFLRERVGQPFLDEYFMYQEDVFLSWKLRLQGMTVAMAQDSVVHHRGSMTVKQQTPELVTFYQERNRLLNALLLYEVRTLLLLLPLFILDAFAKLVLSVFAGRKSLPGIVRAYWWIINHNTWIQAERAKLQSTRVCFRQDNYVYDEFQSCRCRNTPCTHDQRSFEVLRAGRRACIPWLI